MLLRSLLIGFLLLSFPPLQSQSAPRPIVRSIQVLGNVRVPTATVLHYLSVVPDSPFDEGRARADLRKLYALGVFESLDILAREAEEGQIDLVYHVRERPIISDFAIEGASASQEGQIRHLLEQEKLLLLRATPLHPETANKAALAVRAYLRAHKYPFAEVRVLTEEDKSHTVRVRLGISLGPRLDIGEVEFSGNRSIATADLLKQLRRTRPTLIWAPWTETGAYVPENVAADLDNLRRYYQSRGFAAVSIGEPQTVVRNFRKRWWMPLPGIGGSKEKLSILIPILEGPRFTLASVVSEGDAKTAGSEVAEILGSVKVPAVYDFAQLDTTRRMIIGALGHSGYALAQVQLAQILNDSDRTIAARYQIQSGDPVAIGRVDFEGNSRLRDKFLRREVVVCEGEIFDSAKLDESIKRLNRSGLIQEIGRSDIALEMNEKTEALDLTFKVKEKERRGIYATGGTGGIGGAYLGLLCNAFDLLGLGESLSLEMDGGAAQSNLLLNIIGSRFLGFPFTLGLSVFHRATNINVANLVPDTNDLVNLFRRRATGMGLSGAYAVTSHVQVGLGIQFEDLATPGDRIDGDNQEQASVQRRTDLSPSFVFDSTKGTGPEMRGIRFAVANSWSGSTFLRSVDATAQSLLFSQYLNDPLTRGRNAVALHFQAAISRARNGVPLSLDRRFYPGDEIVRGFRRGGLSPWAYPADSQLSPQPVGADTVLGFSAEYRVPIRGPLSAAAFIDIGWSSFSRSSAKLDKSSRLIEQTNRMLRASVGGELRLQLPLIRQAGRLIFSWNPFRLDKLIEGLSSPLRLADPRSSIHFALGNRF